jgi:hypothetical protein
MEDNEKRKKRFEEDLQKTMQKAKQYSEKVIQNKTNATRQHYKHSFDLGTGYQLKHGRNKYEDIYSYPEDGHIYTNMHSAKPGEVKEYNNYLGDFINYRQSALKDAINEGTNNVSVSGMARTTREGARAEISAAQKVKALLNNRIKPIGYTDIFEQLMYPVYKKPVYKPAPPVRPPVVNVRYDDTYEDLYMRP